MSNWSTGRKAKPGKPISTSAIDHSCGSQQTVKTGPCPVFTFSIWTITAVIVAAVFPGEQLHLYHAAGIALIAAGVILVTLIKQLKQAPDLDT